MFKLNFKHYREEFTNKFLFYFRWPTRVFAVECLMKIISSCEVGEGQFDLQLAKEIKEKTGKSKFPEK